MIFFKKYSFFLAVIIHWFIEYIIESCCSNNKYKSHLGANPVTAGKHTTQLLGEM